MCTSARMCHPEPVAHVISHALRRKRHAPPMPEAERAQMGDTVTGEVPPRDVCYSNAEAPPVHASEAP